MESNDDISHSISPISPCSPFPGSVSVVEAVLLNKEDLMQRACRAFESNDWLWDWSARQNDVSNHGDSDTSSICQVKANDATNANGGQNVASTKKQSLRHWAIRHGLFSKEILSMFFFSNLLSLVVGAGIGYTVLIRRTL